MSTGDDGIQVALVAPSSVVPPVELEIGAAKLAAEGFVVHVHSQCLSAKGLYAGSDEERAMALYECAIDPRFDVIWAARGGYGATRLLPLLDRLAAERGFPQQKLYVGYSDSTAIMEFTRSRWGWRTLHAPMPATRSFALMTPREWKSLVDLVRGGRSNFSPSGGKALRFMINKPKRAIRGPLVGGNLAVWSALAGTPASVPARGKLIFFEDVAESISRLDRMVEQVYQSGQLDQTLAIVLGEFEGCDDQVPQVLRSMPPRRKWASALRSPRAEDLMPLRPILSRRQGIETIFADLGRRLGIPVASSLPVGHGKRNLPLPLGAEYRLSPSGELKLLAWD